MIEPGRVCVKKTGRDAGKKCIVINVLDEKFVEIICAGRKKARRCNIRHLIPTKVKIDPRSEEEIKKTLGD